MEAAVMRSALERFTVADFVQWHREGRLILNPYFQRRSIWTLDARSYLIDTMLLGFPIPKVYLRTKIDTKTQVSVRDVVDGQQRLRAILDFTANKLVLNTRSELFKGQRYGDLEPEQQQSFLSYPISVEHLINATDAIVLEAFSRLNSYNLPLNPAEKRHALYQTELKWFIHALSNDLREFLVRYEVISTASMLRMEDDAFFGGLVDIVLNGIGDGGASALNVLYRTVKGDIPNANRVRQIVIAGIEWMDENLGAVLEASPLSRSYQVQMIFAAYAHQRFGLPPGRMSNAGHAMPEKRGIAAIDQVIDRMSVLTQALDTDDEDNPYAEFVKASSGATTRFSSRRVRFLEFNRAISRQ